MAWVFLILIFIAFLILLLPVKVYFNYYRYNWDDKLEIKVDAFFGLLFYRFEISAIKIRNWILGPIMEIEAEVSGAKGKKKEEVINEYGVHSINLKDLLKKLKFFLKITDQFDAMTEMLKSFRKEDQDQNELWLSNATIYRVVVMLIMSIKGECRKLIWYTHFGFSDASITGMSNGLIWAGKLFFVEILSIFSDIKTTPDLKVIPHYETAGVDIQFESIFSVRIGKLMITGLRILVKEYKRRAKNRWPIIQLKH
ncbi:MAG: DUF2953 domain-containing protein [Halanaerobiales bacterium]|nr:DUF2953 domain-containing protein [Halanaerobiales bacterium]